MTLFTSFQFIFILIGLHLIGNLFLKGLNIREIRGLQNLTVSFWLGYFFYGVFLFIIQLITPITKEISVLICLIGFPSLFIKSQLKRNYLQCDKGIFYSALFILALALTFPKAAIPPIEEISLAREFALAKAFSETGVFTLPHFLKLTDTPLHTHALNSVMYRFGGEKMMLLFNWWTLFMSGLAVYTLARRRLQGAHAWLLTAVVFSLPLFSKASGLGLPVLKLIGIYAMAAWSLSIYARSEHVKWLLITSVFTGLALSVSFYGLFFAIAMAFCIFMSAKDFGWKHSLIHNSIFIILTPILGSIWFIWFMDQLPNYTLNTVLTSFFIDQPRTWKELITFPYMLMTQEKTSVFSYHVFGPLFLMILPPVILHFIKRFPFWDWSISLDTPTLLSTLSLGYYVIWFFFDKTLEPIALLPIMPLFLIPLWESINSIRAKSRFVLRNSIIVFVLSLLSLQMGISVKNNQQPISVFFRHENPLDYVKAYDTTSIISAYMKEKEDISSNKIMHTNLPALNYHFGSHSIEVPSVHALSQKISHTAVIPALNEIMAQHVDYWITSGNAENPLEDTQENGHATLRALIHYGCFYKKITDDTSLSVYRFVKNCAGKPKGAFTEKAMIKEKNILSILDQIQ